MSEKFEYRVKPGRRFGSFFEHGPGSIVELTESQAGGFLDTLELVKESDDPDPESARDYLLGLTVKQLTNFPEFGDLPNPKPTEKEEIVDAILESRSLEDEDSPPEDGSGSDEPDAGFAHEVKKGKLFLDRETAEGMTVAELKERPEWEAVIDPKPTLKDEIINAILAVNSTYEAE